LLTEGERNLSSSLSKVSLGAKWLGSGHGQSAKAAVFCLSPTAPIGVMPMTPIREGVTDGLVRAKVVVAIRWIIGIRRKHVVRLYRCVVVIVRRMVA
jgi:hypothetical protein